MRTINVAITPAMPVNDAAVAQSVILSRRKILISSIRYLSPHNATCVSRDSDSISISWACLSGRATACHRARPPLLSSLLLMKISVRYIPFSEIPRYVNVSCWRLIAFFITAYSPHIGTCATAGSVRKINRMARITRMTTLDWRPSPPWFGLP